MKKVKTHKELLLDRASTCGIFFEDAEKRETLLEILSPFLKREDVQDEVRVLLNGFELVEGEEFQSLVERLVREMDMRQFLTILRMLDEKTQVRAADYLVDVI